MGDPDGRDDLGIPVALDCPGCPDRMEVPLSGTYYGMTYSQVY
jgi:hypothetical protein